MLGGRFWEWANGQDAVRRLETTSKRGNRRTARFTAGFGERPHFLAGLDLVKLSSALRDQAQDGGDVRVGEDGGPRLSDGGQLNSDRPPARPLFVDRAPAISSFPMPDSPLMTTEKGDVATRGILALRCGWRKPTWILPTTPTMVKEAIAFAPAAYIRHDGLPDPRNLDARGVEQLEWVPGIATAS